MTWVIGKKSNVLFMSRIDTYVPSCSANSKIRVSIWWRWSHTYLLSRMQNNSRQRQRHTHILDTMWYTVARLDFLKHVSFYLHQINIANRFYFRLIKPKSKCNKCLECRRAHTHMLEQCKHSTSDINRHWWSSYYTAIHVYFTFDFVSFAYALFNCIRTT